MYEINITMWECVSVYSLVNQYGLLRLKKVFCDSSQSSGHIAAICLLMVWVALERILVAISEKHQDGVDGMWKKKIQTFDSIFDLLVSLINTN